LSDNTPEQDGTGKPPRRSGALTGAAALLALVLGKLKLIGGLLLSGLKLFKLGQLGGTVVTLAVSAAFYASRYGAAFGIGLVLLILLHELGHGYMAKRLGLNVSAPIFIPGFGALILLKDQNLTTWQHTLVGAGGPLFGLAGALGCYALAQSGLLPEGAGLLTALAFFTAQINLFNLIPVFGLDGDRITASLDRNRLTWALVFVIGIAVALGGAGTGAWLVIITVLLGVKLVTRWKAGVASAEGAGEAMGTAGFPLGEGEGTPSATPGMNGLASEPEQWRALALYLALAFGLAYLAAHASRHVLPA